MSNIEMNCVSCKYPDYVIIGAGTAGLYIARHLLKYSKSILVIDRRHNHEVESTYLLRASISLHKTESIGNILSLATLKTWMINGNPLYWILLLFNLPFMFSHQNVLSSAISHMKYDKILSEHLICRRLSSTLDTGVWKKLKEYLDISGVNFLRGNVTELNSHSITLASGDEIMFRKKVFVCTGPHVELIPFPYRHMVCRYPITVYKGAVSLALRVANFINGVLLLPQREHGIVLLAGINNKTSHEIRKALESRGVVVTNMTKVFQGYRVVSPDGLPFYIDFDENKTWCTGGSFAGVFTLYMMTLNAVQRNHDEMSFNGIRFVKRSVYGVLAFVLLILIHRYGSTFARIPSDNGREPAEQILMYPADSVVIDGSNGAQASSFLSASDKHGVLAV